MRSERSHEQSIPANQGAKTNEKLVSIDKDYAQMVLDSIYINASKERLHSLIDKALDQRDREAFMKYSDAYRQLNK
ncbi:hypothetical protein GCM10011391_17660 [Pullulanibacillus camelliae]|uniref:IDEAL domain-containing protein n=1 Tax=Pullulanibacillus camelliae TaxID=1707096 RepID=A0A8J2VWD5_9BACL|nr:IDEAL domain-containing protein [Pullulanibacillus camelliae]GGE39352.1 hypothetical protein GCM10011391_17660 [Pullulanibacillus camelliae]